MLLLEVTTVSRKAIIVVFTVLVIVILSTWGVIRFNNFTPRTTTEWRNYPTTDVYTLENTKMLINDSLKENYILNIVFEIDYHKANAEEKDFQYHFPFYKSYISKATLESTKEDCRYIILWENQVKFLIKIDLAEQNLIFNKIIELKILELTNPFDSNYLIRRSCGLDANSEVREVKSKEFIGASINNLVFLDIESDNQQAVQAFSDWFENRYRPKLLEKKDGEYINVFDYDNLK